MHTQNLRSFSLDKVGIWVSSLCAVHCLLLPILPLLASTVVGEEWFERTILMVSILVGFVSLLVSAIRQHGQYYPLLLMLAGGFVYWHKHELGHHWEPLVITIGAAMIVAGHWLNLRLSRQCECCSQEVLRSPLNNANEQA